MILFLESNLSYYAGGPPFIFKTADRLGQMGLDVAVLAQNINKSFIEAYPRVNCFSIGGYLPNTVGHWLLAPFLFRRVGKAISGLKADVLFPQAAPASHWAFLYKSRHKQIPCIWYCHEPTSFIHNLDSIMGLKGVVKYGALLLNPALQMMDRWLARYADHILANSQFTAERVKKIYGREAEVVYPAFIELDKFKTNAKKEDFLFTVGRLRRIKRMDLILKALAILHNKGKSVNLVMAGDGEEKDNLVRLSRALNLEPQVRFAGALPDEEVRQYMSRARAVVFPSVNEPFGQVPVEAMACGTPVIASDSGGPRETVLEGKTGYHFKTNDAASLAEKIDLVMGNNLMPEMATAARKHVEQNFTLEITCQKLYNIFSKYVV